MKLVKTTGGVSEGAGVIEAILSWWNTFRTDSNEDTSANLFKKSASLIEEDRLTFVESMQRVGVSTVSAVQTTVASAEGEQGSRQGAASSAQAKSAVAKSNFMLTKAKDRILHSSSSRQAASGPRVETSGGELVSWLGGSEHAVKGVATLRKHLLRCVMHLHFPRSRCPSISACDPHFAFSVSRRKQSTQRATAARLRRAMRSPRSPRHRRPPRLPLHPRGQRSGCRRLQACWRAARRGRQPQTHHRRLFIFVVNHVRALCKRP